MGVSGGASWVSPLGLARSVTRTIPSVCDASTAVAAVVPEEGATDPSRTLCGRSPFTIGSTCGPAPRGCGTVAPNAETSLFPKNPGKSQ